MPEATSVLLTVMLHGYQIYATARTGRSVKDSGLEAGRVHASYTEAETDDAAYQRCLLQFPLFDGWTDHYVKNLDTGIISGCEIPSLSLESEPLALSLDGD